MGNIKTFEQYIAESFQEVDEMPDEFFDVIGDSRATQMLVSLTKTVKTDSPDTTGWDVHDALMKEMMSAIEGVDGFRFAGDSFNRVEGEDGGFTIVADIKLIYTIPADTDDVDLNAVFSGMSADVDVAISELE